MVYSTNNEHLSFSHENVKKISPSHFPPVLDVYLPFASFSPPDQEWRSISKKQWCQNQQACKNRPKWRLTSFRPLAFVAQPPSWSLRESFHSSADPPFARNCTLLTIVAKLLIIVTKLLIIVIKLLIIVTKCPLLSDPTLIIAQS